MNNVEKELITDLAEPSLLVAIVITLAEIIKQLGVPNKFIPLVDIGIGVGISLLKNCKEKGVAKSVILGIALGLSGCGAFSGFKNLVIK